MYTPINQYIERLENISFDVDELNKAVSELVKIRPFENENIKPGMLKSNAICLNYDEKELDEWFGGNIRGKDHDLITYDHRHHRQGFRTSAFKVGQAHGMDTRFQFRFRLSHLEKIVSSVSGDSFPVDDKPRAVI